MEIPKLSDFENSRREGLRIGGRARGLQLREEGPKGQFGTCHISYAVKAIDCVFAIYGTTGEELNSVLLENPVKKNGNSSSIGGNMYLRIPVSKRDPTNLDRVSRQVLSIVGGRNYLNGHFVSKQSIVERESQNQHDKLFTLLIPLIKGVYEYINPTTKSTNQFLDSALSVVAIMPNGNRNALLKILKGGEQFIKIRLDALKKGVKNLMEFCETHQITDSQLELVTDALFLRNGKKESPQWNKMVLLPFINLIVNKQWNTAKEYRDYLFANFQDWFPDWRREKEKGENPLDYKDFIVFARKELDYPEAKFSPETGAILAEACKIPRKAVLALK